VTCQHPGFQGDVTRDPIQEARYDEVTRLAELDARGGLEMRVLTGDLAGLQDEYDDAFTEALAAKGAP
jgi:hypothetical protein